VLAAQGGNLEEARHLAELSAQAMNGSLSKSALAKMGVAVPEPRPAPIAPANVQLQKEMIKKTYQQITALSHGPSSGGGANTALAQLNTLYEDVREHPVAASDYLIILQTGQLPMPRAVQMTSSRPPAGTVCGESSLGADALPAERREYLSKQLLEAQDRLRHINEALRKLIAINTAEQAQIDQLTDQIGKDYDAAQERAYDFVVTTLIDLPLDKYVDIHDAKVKEMEDQIKGLIAKSMTPMSAPERAAITEEIKLRSSLKYKFEDSFTATNRLLAMYSGANYGKDINQWEQDGRNSGEFKRGLDAAVLAGNILLDHPKLNDYLEKAEWFGNNKLWQLKAMGKMASYASGFFGDVMDLYAAWGPLASALKNDLNNNTQGMEQLRQKAAQTEQEISCFRGLLR
jgi:hypothetical protein